MKHWDVTDEQWIQVGNSRLDDSFVKFIVKDLSGINPMTSTMTFDKESARAFAEDILKRVGSMSRQTVKAKLQTLDIESLLKGDDGWKFIATDKNGNAYLYSKEPTMKNHLGVWSNNGSYFQIIGKLFSEDEMKDLWKDSLFRIEELKNVKGTSDKVSKKSQLKQNYLGLQFELDVKKAIADGWRYLAIDKSGGMYLHMNKPHFTYAQWVSGTLIKQVKKFSPDSVRNIWKGSLLELRSLL